MITKDVSIPFHKKILRGELAYPAGGKAIVIFCNSNNYSEVNLLKIEEQLNVNNIATLVIKRDVDNEMHENEFNLYSAKDHIIQFINWIHSVPEMKEFRVGIFGTNTTSAAALFAAAELKGEIDAIVTQSGSPEPAKSILHQVNSPTLLIVGELDEKTVDINMEAYTHLISEKKLSIIKGSSCNFEEAGKTEEVAMEIIQWFSKYLTGLAF